MPKKSLLISVFLLITFVALTAFYLASQGFLIPTPKGQTHQVTLTENGFTPPEIQIKPGDSIKFSTTLNEPYWPASDLHPTHGIYPEFDPQEPIDQKTTWTFKFLKTGKWKYHDHLQPIFRGIIQAQ